MKHLILIGFLFVSLQSGVVREKPTPKPLGNQDVIEMSKAGLTSEIIIAKMKRSDCEFETSTSKLAELKSEGVADDVVKAMIEWKPESVEPKGPAKENEEKETENSETVAAEKIQAALRRIENATSVGVTLQNYSSLLIENKSVVDENLKQLKDDQLKREIEDILNDHQYALGVWNLAAANGWAYFFTKQEPGRTLVTRYGYPAKISIWTNVPVMNGLSYIWLSARNRYNNTSVKLKKLTK